MLNSNWLLCLTPAKQVHTRNKWITFKGQRSNFCPLSFLPCMNKTIVSVRSEVIIFVRTKRDQVLRGTTLFSVWLTLMEKTRLKLNLATSLYPLSRGCPLGECNDLAVSQQCGRCEFFLPLRPFVGCWRLVGFHRACPVSFHQSSDGRCISQILLNWVRRKTPIKGLHSADTFALSHNPNANNPYKLVLCFIYFACLFGLC